MLFRSIHEVSIKFGALTGPMGGILSLASSMLIPLGSLAMIYPVLSAMLHAHTIATVAHAVANKIGAVAQWLLNTAMYACPLVWIIALIVAVIAIVVLMVKHWKQIKEAVGAFADGAKKKLGEFRDWVGSKFDAVKEDLRKGIEAWKDLGAKFGGAIHDGLKRSSDAIKNWWASEAHKWFERYDEFKKIGEKLMEALKEGMAKAKKALQDEAGKIADSIRKFFGGSLPEVGPLKHIEV